MTENYEEKLLDLVIKAENGNHNLFRSTPLEVLKDIFCHNGFKPQQQEIITRILNKEGHSLGIMPTGGGKSVCFQIPALIQKNLTVVVSPLIALMKDQIDNLVDKGTNTAFFINSTISERTKERILSLVENNKIKLLYLAPESLKSERILDVLKKIKIDLFVIDEAHCISTWGHNFRPDYLRLPVIINELDSPQILALTATATKEVEEDIQNQLKIKCKVFKASFDRPNLFIAVVPLEAKVKKELFLIELLKKTLKGPAIVFASYRKTTEKLSLLLNAAGIKSVFYHAGLLREEREKIQNQFISGDCDVIVATIAFGMGIDKSNIRNIIHYNLPQSIENYYQEVGRAGRDGNISNCVVLFTKSDESKIKSLISSSWPSKQKIKDIISYMDNKNSKYFFTTMRKLNFDCDVKEIPANLILHRLEESEAIRIYTNVLHQIKPIFAKSFPKIINEVPNKYKEDLEKIFSCDFFKSKRRSWLPFEEIMDHTNLNYFRIIEIFKYLRDNDLLRYPEVRRMDLIWIRKDINNFDINPLVKLFDSILIHDLEKVEQLIKSLMVSGCIRGSILRYFDEPHLKDHCEMCSNCIGDNLTSKIEVKIDDNYAEDEDIEFIKDLRIDTVKDALPIVLLKSIANDKSISSNDFVNILVGDLHHFSSKWKFNLTSYNLLEQFKDKKNVLEEVIQTLNNNEFLKEEVDGILRITKKGIKHVLDNTEDVDEPINLSKHSEPWILGEKKDPEDIPQIIEFTRSDNANERKIAASALGKMADLKPQMYDAVPCLILLLKDQKPQVRQYAIKSLGLIQDKRALTHLEVIAKNDEKEYNRISARKAISKMIKTNQIIN